MREIVLAYGPERSKNEEALQELNRLKNVAVSTAGGTQVLAGYVELPFIEVLDEGHREGVRFYGPDSIRGFVQKALNAERDEETRRNGRENRP